MPTSGRLNLLACQISVPPMTTVAQRDAHLAASVDKVRLELAAATEQVDLVVLPELSSLDYARTTFSQLDALAEPLTGASFQAWRQLAMEAKVHVLFSFARAGTGGPFITVGVVQPNGDLVGHYDKLHLAQYGASMEKEYFNRGGHLFTFEVKGFCLAPIICYDIRIPELSRTLVLDHGVDVILHCGAYYRDESFHTWHPFVIARALENQIFFLSLNRAGKTYGNSLFCLPWMDEKTPSTTFADKAEEFRLITLERSELEQARQDYTFLKDRLESYGIKSLTA